MRTLLEDKKSGVRILKDGIWKVLIIRDVTIGAYLTFFGLYRELKKLNKFVGLSK